MYAYLRDKDDKVPSRSERECVLLTAAQVCMCDYVYMCTCRYMYVCMYVFMCPCVFLSAEAFPLSSRFLSIPPPLSRIP